MDPSTYSERKSRQLLEERLESIISAAALMADADCTRDERRERIVAECNAVRQALQDLLSQYMANVSNFANYNFRCLKFYFQNLSVTFGQSEAFGKYLSGFVFCLALILNARFHYCY